jgi:hypothetical protein
MEKLELCKVIRGTGGNALMKQMVSFVMSAVKNFNEICQMKGQIAIYNYSSSDSALAVIWPKGFYRSSIKVYDNFDENIYTFALDSVKGK